VNLVKLIIKLILPVFVSFLLLIFVFFRVSPFLLLVFVINIVLNIMSPSIFTRVFIVFVSQPIHFIQVFLLSSYYFSFLACSFFFISAYYLCFI